jgi:hypothetical protein
LRLKVWRAFDVVVYFILFLLDLQGNHRQ